MSVASQAQGYTAFRGSTVLQRGALLPVALAVKAALEADPAASVLVFEDAGGRVIDLDLRGDAQAIAARLPASPGPAAAPRGRGRPKLGVVSREVTLLPRHWEWLNAQRGGASQALRRLVDEARRADGGRTRSRLAQEAAYRFMSAIAGDLPGFEEASRALFAGDSAQLSARIAHWPADIAAYLRELAAGTHLEDD